MSSGPPATAAAEATGFVPSERPEDCVICRQAKGETDAPGTGGDYTPHTAASPTSATAEEATPDLTPEQTFAELVKRLRALLSRQNVSVDPSIALLMVGSPWMLSEQSPSSSEESGGGSSGAELYITVEALMSHPFIGSLKASQETVIRAAEAVGPHVLRVDREGGRIYPIMKAERCTLILRDLECEVEELRDFVAGAPTLHKYTDSEPILEIRKEMIANDINWFVTLPCADDTTDTALWLRSQKFKDQVVRVGIKSESAFQSFMSRPPPTWNMEGAFVPLVAMQYREGGKGRLRRAGSRGGRMGRGGRRNWPDGRRGLSRGTSRMRGGGPRRGSRYPPDWYKSTDRDTGEQLREDEVDPSEFPPLMESAKMCNFGYGAREFKQYSPTTLRELRDRVHSSAAEVTM